MTEAALLVASVYSPSPHNAAWLGLQRSWLRRTLGATPYRFGIVVNGTAAVAVPEGVERIAQYPENRGHAAGLAAALAWMRAQPAFDHGLVLDSDAFPVSDGWYDRLRTQMARFGKRIAAPVRFENLDRFPHPSAMLLARSVLDEPWFALRDGIEATNLLGDSIRDVAASLADRHAEVLPLLRSNAVNLHPVAAAIYHDCFYHHGAGSREFRFRVTDRYRLLEHWPAPLETPEGLASRLFADDEGFVALLRGTADAVRAL